MPRRKRKTIKSEAEGEIILETKKTRTRKVITPESEKRDTLTNRSLDKREILMDAKKAGLFVYEKYTKKYVITLSNREYKEI